MDNKQKNFIVKFHHTICNMPSNYYGYSNSTFGVSFKIKDDMIETVVGTKTFTDTLPKKGSRRDRRAVADIVCEHICESWGGTMEEVTEFCGAFLTELLAILDRR